MLLGLASIIYIIQDFNVGPSSDLAQMERELKYIPAKVWMYIWLAIVLAILALNLKMLFSKKTSAPIPPKAETGRKRINTTRRYNPIKKK